MLDMHVGLTSVLKVSHHHRHRHSSQAVVFPCWELITIYSYFSEDYKVSVALDQTAVPADSKIHLRYSFRPAGRKTRVETHRGQRCLRGQWCCDSSCVLKVSSQGLHGLASLRKEHTGLLLVFHFLDGELSGDLSNPKRCFEPVEKWPSVTPIGHIMAPHDEEWYKIVQRGLRLGLLDTINEAEYFP